MACIVMSVNEEVVLNIGDLTVMEASTELIGVWLKDGDNMSLDGQESLGLGCEQMVANQRVPNERVLVAKVDEGIDFLWCGRVYTLFYPQIGDRDLRVCTY